MIQHCRKTLHSRTKGNRLVIQFQKALWRKLQPLFNRDKKLYASKEVEENALSSEGKSCRPETNTTLTVNWYVCYNLSVWNKWPSIKCRTRFQSIYLAGENTYWNKLHFGMRRGRLCLPPPLYCGSSTSKLSVGISFDRRLIDGWREDSCESWTHRYTEYFEFRSDGVLSTDWALQIN